MIGDDKINACRSNCIQSGQHLDAKQVRFLSCCRVDLYPNSLPTIQVIEQRAVAATEVQYDIIDADIGGKLSGIDASALKTAVILIGEVDFTLFSLVVTGA